jgi:hypothetical protein
VLLGLALLDAPALGQRHAGSDPHSNFKPGQLPASCGSTPTGARCINAAVYYLDQARAKLQQGPYRLPANFPRLTPGRQILILTNLDRRLYRLAPITGLTSALDLVALGGRPGDPGVVGDGDPILNAPGVQTTSNWAGGFPNIVLAYEAWMFNDGPGGNNLDCTSPHSTGCWAHRHDILAKFLVAGPSAMGVAAGKDSRGVRGYAMLIAKGNSSYTAGYSYRWSQAVANGAGRHRYAVARPDTRTMKLGSVSMQGRTLIVRVQAPKGISLRCSLSRSQGGRWSRARFHRCGAVARFRNVSPGRYRVEVSSSLGTVSTVLSVTPGR